MSIIHFPQAPHVSFNQETKTLRCDRCPCEEPLEAGHEEGHIVAFAKGHMPCPEVSTEQSRQEAKQRVGNAAFWGFFGL